MAHPSDVVYSPADRPLCEVLRDGVWYDGEVRAWFRREDGWDANVSWSKGPAQTHLDTVPGDHVRAAAAPDEPEPSAP